MERVEVEEVAAAAGEMRRIVMLPGLFGAQVSPAVVKEMQERAQERCKVVAVHPGPVSSLHDRAVECFYMLKGGRAGSFLLYLPGQKCPELDPHHLLFFIL